MASPAAGVRSSEFTGDNLGTSGCDTAPFPVHNGRDQGQIIQVKLVTEDDGIDCSTVIDTVF